MSEVIPLKIFAIDKTDNRFPPYLAKGQRKKETSKSEETYTI